MSLNEDIKRFPCVRSLSLSTCHDVYRHRVLCSLDAGVLTTTARPLTGATDTWCMHTPQAAQRPYWPGRKAISLSRERPPRGYDLCAETLHAWIGGGLEVHLQSPT